MKNFARWLFMKYWLKDIKLLIALEQVEEADEGWRAGIRLTLKQLKLANEVKNNAN